VMSNVFGIDPSGNTPSNTPAPSRQSSVQKTPKPRRGGGSFGVPEPLRGSFGVPEPLRGRARRELEILRRHDAAQPTDSELEALVGMAADLQELRSGRLPGWLLEELVAAEVGGSRGARRRRGSRGQAEGLEEAAKRNNSMQ
jgi:hypothetical protein